MIVNIESNDGFMATNQVLPSYYTIYIGDDDAKPIDSDVIADTCVERDSKIWTCSRIKTIPSGLTQFITNPFVLR